MESYELDPDKIINWAAEYAGYDDLKKVAKATYGMYVIRRKRENPAEQAAARRTKKKYKNRAKS